MTMEANAAILPTNDPMLALLDHDAVTLSLHAWAAGIALPRCENCMRVNRSANAKAFPELCHRE